MKKKSNEIDFDLAREAKTRMDINSIVFKRYTPADFKEKLAYLRDKADYFRYQEDSNDIREAHLQFMDDIDLYLEYFEELVVALTEALKYYKSINRETERQVEYSNEAAATLNSVKKKFLEKGIDPIEPMKDIEKISDEINERKEELQRRKMALDKAEEEIAITQELLAKKKSELEQALQHRYTLTDKQKQCLIEEKDRILDGIEQWGSITGACSHDRNIKTPPSTIQLFCARFPEFAEAVKVSKAIFKDRLDAIMVDRAIEGTENPVFGKGEHIGDYKIKDNRLFLELVKAKMPEEYNKKAIEAQKNTQVNNLNIISFANIDETEKGFTKDVGVVLDVDETGRVQRITQEKKLKEFYEKKPGAEIIEAEVVEESADELQ